MTSRSRFVHYFRGASLTSYSFGWTVSTRVTQKFNHKKRVELLDIRMRVVERRKIGKFSKHFITDIDHLVWFRWVFVAKGAAVESLNLPVPPQPSPTLRTFWKSYTPLQWNRTQCMSSQLNRNLSQQSRVFSPRYDISVRFCGIRGKRHNRNWEQ